jgi:hypothetical protein
LTIRSRDGHADSRAASDGETVDTSGDCREFANENMSHWLATLILNTSILNTTETNNWLQDIEASQVVA